MNTVVLFHILNIVVNNKNTMLGFNKISEQMVLFLEVHKLLVFNLRLDKMQGRKTIFF